MRGKKRIDDAEWNDFVKRFFFFFFRFRPREERGREPHKGEKDKRLERWK